MGLHNVRRSNRHCPARKKHDRDERKTKQFAHYATLEQGKSALAYLSYQLSYTWTFPYLLLHSFLLNNTLVTYADP